MPLRSATFFWLSAFVTTVGPNGPTKSLTLVATFTGTFVSANDETLSAADAESDELKRSTRVLRNIIGFIHFFEEESSLSNHAKEILRESEELDL
jgi:hypothetical protein